MAGDWIPMRLDLAEDPAVIGVAAELKISEVETVGLLHRLWGWANRHTVDGGAAVSVTADWIDRYVGKEGFSAALAAQDWLFIRDCGIAIPKWDVWNSYSAKKRMDARQRQSEKRARDAGHGTVTRLSREKDLIPRQLRRAIYDRDSHRCVYCGRAEGECPANEPKSEGSLSLDHIIPESCGGTSSADNLVTACVPCNREKSDRTPDEAGMPWPVVTIMRDKRVTNELPEKRREENSREEDSVVVSNETTPSRPPSAGGNGPKKVGRPKTEQHPEAAKMAMTMAKGIKHWKSDARVTCESAASLRAFDALLRIDGRDVQECRQVLYWLFNCETGDYEASGQFDWRPNVASGGALRKQYDRLVTQMNNQAEGLSAQNGHR